MKKIIYFLFFILFFNIVSATLLMEVGGTVTTEVTGSDSPPQNDEPSGGSRSSSFVDCTKERYINYVDCKTRCTSYVEKNDCTVYPFKSNLCCIHYYKEDVKSLEPVVEESTTESIEMEEPEVISGDVNETEETEVEKSGAVVTGRSFTLKPKRKINWVLHFFISSLIILIGRLDNARERRKRGSRRRR